MGPPATDLVDRTAAIEGQGFDSLWWADHLMGWIPDSVWTPDIGEVAKYAPNPNVYFDPVAAMSVAAVATERVTLGTCVTDAIRRHPAMLANEFLTLHHIAKGRVILGLGAGEGENIVPYGMTYDYQVSKLEEALKVIRLLWNADGAVDFDGRFFRLERAVLGLRGYEDRVPEIWIGANGPRMCRIAGELADGWIPVMMPLRQYEERLAWISSARSQAGRAEDPFTAAMFCFAVLGDDPNLVDRLLDHPFVKGLLLSLPGWAYEDLGFEHPLGRDFHGLAGYIPSKVPRDEALRLIDAIPKQVAREYMLHGDAAEVKEKVGTYFESGLSHLVIQNVGFLGDLSTAKDSFRVLGDIRRGLAERFG